MPLRKLTRVEHIVRAMQALETAEESLKAIDLRRCPGELREAVKQARTHAGDGLGCAHQALRYEATHVPRPSIAPPPDDDDPPLEEEAAE